MTRFPWVLAGVFGILLVATSWYRVNLSRSLPRGLYALTAVQVPVQRETLVVFAPPTSVHAFVPWWMPLLKPVAAVPGDRVCVVDETLFIGARSYGPVYTSADGKALPKLTGCLHIQAGEVFVASPQRGSLDGRYMGPTPVAALKAQAVPVWTWE